MAVECLSLRPPEPTRYLQNSNTSMAMKHGLLLCEKNIHYKHATMEFSETNPDIGQIKNKKFQILPDIFIQITQYSWGHDDKEVILC